MFNLFNCNKTPIKIFLIVLVIIFGIYLRTLAYFQNSSFFLDEGFLILNIEEKNYLQLFSQIDYNQASPPLFLVLSKLVYQIFGVNEMALRFFPYIASVLALILFYFLAKKVFNNYFAISLSLFAFAINPKLIRMSQYFKSYSVDVLLVVIALIIILNIDLKNMNKNKALGLGILAAISVWLSYTMLFVIAGVSIVFLIKILLEQKKELVASFLVYAAPNVIGFFIYYVMNLRYVHANKSLIDFWMLNFFFFPKNISEYKSIVSFVFQYANIFTITILLILGIFIFLRKDKFTAWILFSPILLTLSAGFLYLYPFAHRLIIFLVPIFILLFFKPLDEINTNKKLYSSFIILLAVISLYPVCTKFCYPVITNKHSFSLAETREGYMKLKQELKPDEIIYMHYFNTFTFKPYNENLKIPKRQVVHGIFDPDFYNKYIQDLEKLPKNKKIWFVLLDKEFTHNEIIVFIKWINSNCIVEKRQKYGNLILIKAQRK